MKRTGTRPAIGLLVVLVLVLGSGCLRDDAPGTTAADPATDAAPADADAGDGDRDEASGEVTAEDAYATMQSALAALADDGNGSDVELPERVSMRFVLTSHNASDSRGIDVGVFADQPNGIAFVAFEGEGFPEEIESDPMMSSFFGGGGFIAGQAWKTTFFGPRDGLLVTYNASAEPAAGWSDATAEAGGGTETLDDVFEELGAIDFADVDDVRFITYNDKRALEITVDGVNGTETTTGRIVVYTEPAFPALIDLTVTNPAATDPWEREQTIRGEFDHGESATHPLLPTLLRLEAMAFLTTDDMESAFTDPAATVGGSRTWTIQPSHFPEHRAALSAVTAFAEPADDAAGTALTFSLEDGSVENADVRLAFDDKDGDGKVSSGDTLTVTYLSAAGTSFGVGFLDEESGLRMTPGPGLPVAFLAALGVAFLLRRGGAKP